MHSASAAVVGGRGTRRDLQNLVFLTASVAPLASKSPHRRRGSCESRSPAAVICLKNVLWVNERSVPAGDCRRGAASRSAISATVSMSGVAVTAFG